MLGGLSDGRHKLGADIVAWQASLATWQPDDDDDLTPATTQAPEKLKEASNFELGQQ